MLQSLSRPYVGPLLHTRFFFGLAFSMFQTIFSLYALTRFNLSVQDTAFILTYVGMLSVLTQGVMISRLTKRFSENSLILSCTAIMAVSLLGWAFAPSVITLLIIMIPTSISGGVLNTVINSASTKAVTPAEIGGILGVSASLESITRIIAPTLGGLMLERLGTGAPGVFGFAILTLLTLYVWRFVYPVSNPLEHMPTPQAVHQTVEIKN
jgi:MFS transporter, DHA1 family, tetracycline resistance protein